MPTADAWVLEDFAAVLRRRMSQAEELKNLTYVRSDKFMLVGEVLKTKELQEALQRCGVDDGSGVSFEEKNGKMTMNSQIANFLEKVVEVDGGSSFEYWPDTGVGSWIRLARGKRPSGSGQYRRNTNGYQTYQSQGQSHGQNGQNQNSSQNGGRPDHDGPTAKDFLEPLPGCQNSFPSAVPTAPPAPAPGTPATKPTPSPTPSPSRGLPGWITRAQAAPAEGACTAPEPWEDVPQAKPKEPEERPSEAKRNKVSNKMRSIEDVEACEDQVGQEDAEAALRAPEPAPAAPQPAPRPKPPPLLRPDLQAMAGGATPATPATPPPPSTPQAAPPQERQAQEGERQGIKRGRIKTFMLEKGFGFVQLEDGKETMDVFVHIRHFEGPKPMDFPGLPGSPPVGEEIEFQLENHAARPRALWAKVVGDALPIDKAKVLSASLLHVLKAPDRYLPDKPQKAGWHKVLDVLASEPLRAAVLAHNSRGMSEIRLGVIPVSLQENLEDMSVCVVAPTAEAASQRIAEAAVAAMNSADPPERGSPSFHLWLEQEAFVDASREAPEAERLYLRLARTEKARDFVREAREVEKPWWQGGGSSQTKQWEPKDLKALCSNPLGDCTADDILKVLGALPVEAPSEVRRYLESWEKRMRLSG